MELVAGRPFQVWGAREHKYNASCSGVLPLHSLSYQPVGKKQREWYRGATLTKGEWKRVEGCECQTKLSLHFFDKENGMGLAIVLKN
jgi:hypothetical protein